jgi:hypothetical protein
MVLLPIYCMVQSTDGTHSQLNAWSLASFAPSRFFSSKGSNVATSSELADKTEVFFNAGSLFEQGEFGKAAQLYEEWIALENRTHEAERPHMTHSSMHRLLKCHIATSHLADAQRWADLLQEAGLSHFASFANHSSSHLIV